MFVSFFPRPKWFFPSAALWALAAIGFWYAFFRHLGVTVGLVAAKPPQVIGVQMLWTPDFLWFDLYYILASALFAGFWRLAAPQKWWIWSVVGSLIILYATYLQVELLVGLVRWSGVFYDLIQDLLGHTVKPAPSLFYGYMLTFLWMGLFYVTNGTLTQFFTSHYVFRWRTAMNDLFTSAWPRVRLIEGASQRIQQDTQDFADTTESLGLTFVQSLMTLIAFTPVLMALSAHITTLPVIGSIPYSLMVVSVVWSLFGTGFLALIGFKLPGLYFKNQRVEAAYRKELVYGEDDPTRAQPPTLKELFANVRKNYYTLFFHYVYFNLGRILYIQVDNLVPFLAMAPSILAGALTFGVMMQIIRAMDQVRGAFQYLVNSWPTIVKLQSIYKRLRSFEMEMRSQPLPKIERSLEPV
jgi:peptide/bleomycin uptake transporter